jgi:hypothetical protein
VRRFIRYEDRDELLPLLLETDSSLQQLLLIQVAAIMMTGGYTKETIASALNVFAGGVTVNVSKIIPLQVFFKLDSKVRQRMLLKLLVYIDF